MSLYECEECHCVENTALGDYWGAKLDGKPVRCSECADGEWHGQFPKLSVEEAGYETILEGPMKGTLQPPGGWK